ncbi:MAG TPA: LamG domain-containing protein, partial [Bacteroidia bacterium]|nr:LamG domain-containing protein [Bacteroidia bacterium]
TPSASTTYTLTVNNGGCTYVGTSTVQISPAPASLNFDGSSTYVDIGTAIHTTSGYTKEAWIYATASGSCNIISSPDAPFWLSGGQLCAAQGFTTSATIIQDPNTFPLNVWTHVAVTYDGPSSTLTLYNNGVAVASNNSVSGYITEDILMGQYQNSNYFQGNMDEVRIWNYARTQTQIQGNMNQGLNYQPQSGLLAYYKMNDAIPNANNTAINTLLDASGNNNTGLLYNFVMNGTSSNFVGDYQMPLITGNSSVCLGGYTNLTAYGIGAQYYTWNPSAYVGAMAYLGPVTTPTVTVTAPDNIGCMATGTDVLNFYPALSDESVTATLPAVCPAGSTTIKTGSSLTNTLYCLRDNNTGAIVDGPYVGNGSGLTFHTGSLTTATTYNVYSQNMGTGLSFDGTNQSVMVHSTPAIDELGGGLTMEAWINPTDVSNPR